MPDLTHLDEAGHARMVDVADKSVTRREAVARARVLMRAATLSKIVEGSLPKGDVLAVARIAGIQAAKRTSELIPLCHPLRLGSVEVDFEADPAGRIDVRCTVRAEDRTGVEMEALTAATVAALTIYDMCKSIEREMRITDIELLSKSGGRTGAWQRPT